MASSRGPATAPPVNSAARIGCGALTSLPRKDVAEGSTKPIEREWGHANKPQHPKDMPAVDLFREKHPVGIVYVGHEFKGAPHQPQTKRETSPVENPTQAVSDPTPLAALAPSSRLNLRFRRTSCSRSSLPEVIPAPIDPRAYHPRLMRQGCRQCLYSCL